jgi:hypothetical protein
MKLTKSLLLASAAGLAAVATASAADLPSKKAAPVEYVKVCPTYGPGFFYIPGTQTCIRVGGSVTAYGYGTTVWRQQNDAVNSNAELRIFVDARDNTEYGLLRTFARINWIRSSGGDDNSGSQPRRGQFFNGNSTGYGNLQTGFSGSEAFVQLGGFLAGRTTSFSWVGPSALQFTTQNPSNGRVNQFAYTASLGNGMSVTAAVEDAAELREGINGATANAIPNNVPDGVLSFDAAQSWGTVKVAGVLHNVAPAGRDTTANSKTGYALTGSAKINLPMIAAGDNLQVFGAYGVGAAGRTIGNTATDTNVANYSYGVGRTNGGLYDGVQTATTLTLTKSYSYGAQLQHFFSPKVSAYVGGTYGKLDIPGSVQNTTTLRDIAVWGVGLGLIWSPVANLEINPEVAYRKATSSAADVASGNAAGEGSALKNDDSWTYRLRVARSF